MDLNKISEQTIMYIVTANLLFVIVLAVELVSYLLLHKSIDKATAEYTTELLRKHRTKQKQR